MAKYHVNPETGEAGQCRARKNCPFGDLEADHYTSPEAAREAYEMKQESFSAPSSREEAVVVPDSIGGLVASAIRLGAGKYRLTSHSGEVGELFTYPGRSKLEESGAPGNGFSKAFGRAQADAISRALISARSEEKQAKINSSARESREAMEEALKELRNLTNDKRVIERFTNRDLFQDGFIVGSKGEGYKPNFEKVREELWDIGSPELADDFEAYLDERDLPGRPKRATKPKYEGTGKIRFYSVTDQSGVNDVANRARNLFERKPFARIGIADRAGGGTGVPNISYNPETKEYGFGKSRMRINTVEFKSKSLEEVVAHAADQEGYSDSEYNPVDWDE